MTALLHITGIVYWTLVQLSRGGPASRLVFGLYLIPAAGQVAFGCAE